MDISHTGPRAPLPASADCHHKTDSQDSAPTLSQSLGPNLLHLTTTDYDPDTRWIIINIKINNKDGRISSVYGTICR